MICTTYFVLIKTFQYLDFLLSATLTISSSRVTINQRIKTTSFSDNSMSTLTSERIHQDLTKLQNGYQRHIAWTVLNKALTTRDPPKSDKKEEDVSYIWYTIDKTESPSAADIWAGLKATFDEESVRKAYALGSCFWIPLGDAYFKPKEGSSRHPVRIELWAKRRAVDKSWMRDIVQSELSDFIATMEHKDVQILIDELLQSNVESIQRPFGNNMRVKLRLTEATDREILNLLKNQWKSGCLFVAAITHTCTRLASVEEKARREREAALLASAVSIPLPTPDSNECVSLRNKRPRVP